MDEFWKSTKALFNTSIIIVSNLFQYTKQYLNIKNLILGQTSSDVAFYRIKFNIIEILLYKKTFIKDLKYQWHKAHYDKHIMLCAFFPTLLKQRIGVVLHP